MIRGIPRVAATVAILAAVASACHGCGSGPGPTRPASSDPPAATVATSALAPAATPRAGDPPVGSIQVEGGDPVVGQLGTYSWAGGGSSSPWLPGAPIAVGAQEMLTVTVAPRVAITEWTARIAPAADQAGAQAVVIASGVGAPVLGAPTAGSWTLAVTVTFAGLGSATYAWRLDVT